MRAIFIIILSVFATGLIAGLTAAPAGAQSCQVLWDFNNGQAAEWAAAGHSVSEGALVADQGAVTTLTQSEMQAVLGTVFPVPSDGVSMGLDTTLGGDSVQLVLAYTNGMSTTQTFDSNGNHSLPAVAGHLMESIQIHSHSANEYDNLTFTAPCALLGPPTPTPWPTPNATSVFSDTLALGEPGFSGPQPPIEVPAPFPLEPITQTIDYNPLWDISNFVGMASATLTVFNLENIPQFLQIFLPFMGMVIGLRLLMKFITRRETVGSDEV